MRRRVNKLLFLILLLLPIKVCAFCPLCIGVALTFSAGFTGFGSIAYPLWIGMLTYSLLEFITRRIRSKAEERFERKKIKKITLTLIKVSLVVSYVCLYIAGIGLTSLFKSRIGIYYGDSTIAMLYFLGTLATHFARKLYTWFLLNYPKPIKVKYGETIFATALNLILTGVFILL